eukprot:12425083-Karenia_brevis.AAC.1
MDNLMIGMQLHLPSGVGRQNADGLTLIVEMCQIHGKTVLMRALYMEKLNVRRVVRLAAFGLRPRAMMSPAQTLLQQR